MGKPANITIEDAQIRFRNFSGKEGQFNREGDRNFVVLLDPDMANVLVQDGWNVKTLEAREEGDLAQPYLQVSVGYKAAPPQIVMITSRGRTQLSESEVALLDAVDIKTADLIIRPYVWEVSGKTGVKAYLKDLFITIEENALDLKYADLPDAPH